MNKNLFSYEVPEDLVAQIPLTKRDSSKLLIANTEKKEIIDSQFEQLPVLLDSIFSLKKEKKKILLIKNNSYVYPARIRIRRKSGARGEVFLLETGDEKQSFSCLLRPQSKLKNGEILYLDSSVETPVFIVNNLRYPSVTLFDKSTSLSQILALYGEMPLPPYICRDLKRVESKQELDRERYQTVYAQSEYTGSAAAPTAGLHFTPELIHQCEENSVEFCHVTLHVGLGTFAPVQTEQIQDHSMHEEIFCVNRATMLTISEYVHKGWPIVFVGTTALRAVESLFRLAYGCNLINPVILTKELKSYKLLCEKLLPFADRWHKTNLFIYPKSKLDIVCPAIGNGIITNFHQPESSLIMLVSALMGYDFLQQIYTHAKESKYRFFSYGDASLLIFKGTSSC